MSDSISNIRLTRFFWLLTSVPSALTFCHFLTVLSPKVLGIAIARYDFCARDMRELSLLKGDMVKIYTKMSANGWWRGEVNGRVSFPLGCSCMRMKGAGWSVLGTSHAAPHSPHSPWPPETSVCVAGNRQSLKVS